MHKFLRTKATKIISSKGRPIILKGVNLGGWLMMEGYILHSLNIPVRKFKEGFAKHLGKRTLQLFEKSFRDNFIQRDDIKRIASYGFNCIRVPFHYRLIENKPFCYDQKGVAYLDRVIKWAQKYKIWVILDLHAAPGSQNCDWHSDSLGEADLWKSESFQKRALALWEFLADRYKNCKSVAGYDLLNEAVLEDTKILNQFYRDLIKRIRGVDKNHILFIEGNNWAMELGCLDEFNDDNYVLSMHAYQPLDFTFNFVPNLSYPGSSGWNKDKLKKYLARYARLSRARAVPVFVGEFGVNSREGKHGEDMWLKDILSCFREAGFHWTYWTYKAIKNNVFPDGIFSYIENPPWVHRQGPNMGLATYSRCWHKHKRDMTRSWHTNNFSLNTKLLKVLCRDAR